MINLKPIKSLITWLAVALAAAVGYILLGCSVHYHTHKHYGDSNGIPNEAKDLEDFVGDARRSVDSDGGLLQPGH